jgi:ribosome-associated translation inhibitor RaiA
MTVNCVVRDDYEISSRFRQSIEERVARLERDAATDEAQIDRLEDIDHIRRQMRLVVAQRAEALRMRLFLDRAQPRLPRPLIEL